MGTWSLWTASIPWGLADADNSAMDDESSSYELFDEKILYCDCNSFRNIVILEVCVVGLRMWVDDQCEYVVVWRFCISYHVKWNYTYVCVDDQYEYV